MSVDILKSIDTKGASMFRKKNAPKSACDNLCRAAALRDEMLFKAALQGPRI
jgi:hypothetical protein